MRSCSSGVGIKGDGFGAFDDWVLVDCHVRLLSVFFAQFSGQLFSKKFGLKLKIAFKSGTAFFVFLVVIRAYFFGLCQGDIGFGARFPPPF